MVRVYSRHYVFYHEIEDDNIRRIVDDFQVTYGNYNDICFATLVEYLLDCNHTDYSSLNEFMTKNNLEDSYLIDMSMI